MINFDLIRPKLFIGSCPRSRTDVDRMAEALGITGVLNLQTDDDFVKHGVAWDEVQVGFQSQNIALMRTPIIDFDRDDLERKVRDSGDLLDQMMAVGHTVYVHCTAGIERAPATVISYIIQSDGVSLAEAVKEVTTQRKCSPFVDVLERVFEQTLLKTAP
ncbi:MAG: protein-tyrosine phosphatase [Parasphingorhabdus sp.]|jgi:protein-tyrosine phosphatase